MLMTAYARGGHQEVYPMFDLGWALLAVHTVGVIIEFWMIVHPS